MDDNKAQERAEIIAALRDLANIYEHNHIAGYKEIRDAADMLEQLTAEPTNEPLTLEELRGMDGEPVWVEFVGKPDGSLMPPLWMLVNVRMRQLVTDVEYVDWSDEGWLAHRRKPDGGVE